MRAAPRPEDVEAALALLFPTDVAVSVVEIGTAGLALFPEEQASLPAAVPARLVEFAAGRQAARRAMAALGHDVVPVPMGRDRAPIWPPGLSGSISHAGGIAAAVLRSGPPLGLDLEADEPLDSDLWPIICSEPELGAHPVTDRGLAVRRVFAAKEAVYKAQFPLTGQVIGFDAVAIAFRNSDFNACFLQGVGPIPEGFEMHGRIARKCGLILAGVAT
ncbi:MAG: 4'-phosphopantetheinyl transferase superfamily protein [Tabrizicola sp.]|nr:4'-phosphopantetheinyl transferase superfamily protein [Tabrizicola sp.]